MANYATNSSFGEGHSINRPPLFQGENYNYWKIRMTLHIKSVDYELWKIVNEGDLIPTKPEAEMNEIDHRLLQMNAKALNLLFCALDAEQFNKVSGCDSAKEAWDKLRVTYEGTNQVRETKISMLIHEYELFKMKNDESISEMFSRFTNIINGLKALGKVYLNAENVRKLLRSLPATWDAKVLAIQEAKDLTKFELDELLGSLMTHEINMKSRAEEEPKVPKKSLALKSSTRVIDSDESDENEDTAMLVRNFKKFMRKQKFHSRPPRRDERRGEERSDPIICYECNKPGHIKTKCPRLMKDKGEKPRFKKKALKAVTWDDSEGSNSESESHGEETANVCLMANDDEVSSSSSSPLDSNDDKPSYDELEENCGLLVDAFELIKEKNKGHRKTIKNLKEQVDYLLNEKSELSEKVTTLIAELNESNEIIVDLSHKLEKDHDIESMKLIKHVSLLESTLAKFSMGSKNLDMLLANQRCAFSKAGLGYESKEKMYTTFFPKGQHIEACSHCGRLYTNSHTCPLMKTFVLNGKVMRKAWVPKGPKATNH